MELSEKSTFTEDSIRQEGEFLAQCKFHNLRPWAG